MLSWISIAVGGRRQNAFSRNLLASAVRALSRFFLRFSFFKRKRKEDLAGAAGTDFIIGDALVIDFGREQEFDGIVAQRDAIAELDEGNPVVEDFEGRFLPFAIQQMAEDHNRLAFAFDAEILQTVLRLCCTRIVTGRACSCRRHTPNPLAISDIDCCRNSIA
jgi:hypothetical protein